MNTRLYLLAGLIGATGAWIAYRLSQGESALPDIAGGVVSTIRGIRNNNPGNLKYNASIKWQGQTGQDAQGFCTFDTMTDGVRAMAIDLKNAQTIHGRNTVYDIVVNYSLTDQDAYVSNVSAALGVDPHDTIDITDPTTLYDYMTAAIKQESGELGYLAALPVLSTGIAES